MKSRLIVFFELILVLILLTSVLPSCVNTRSAIYMDSVSDTLMNATLDDLEPVIQDNDLLSISVSSPNPNATLIFNTPNSISAQASGYLVSQEGFIDFPLLGKVKATGLTKKQLKDSITNNLIRNKLLTEPVVVVRYLNYKITVLGEVARPTVINVPDEKISLLEALGMAGDMTVYAKRNNVMIIREEGGKRTVKRMNLNSKELLSSPYYFLKSNDVVYVEPNRSKIASASNTRVWLPVVMSTLSFTAIVIDRLTR